MSGGILGGIARQIFQQESFFLQTVRARGPFPGEALFAALEVGGIAVLDVGRSPMMLGQGAFLAADDSVEISTSWNASVSAAAFSGTGLTVMLASGQGACAIAGHGGLMRYTLPAGQDMAVDNGHLVAWSKSMKHEVGLAAQSGGLMARAFTSATSGEGLMCHFTGPGEIYIQSHKPDMPTVGEGGSNSNRRAHQAHPLFGCIVAVMVVGFFGLIIGVFIYAAMTGRLEFDGFETGSPRGNRVNYRRDEY